jgi:hypothetical protein
MTRAPRCDPAPSSLLGDGGLQKGSMAHSVRCRLPTMTLCKDKQKLMLRGPRGLAAPCFSRSPARVTPLRLFRSLAGPRTPHSRPAPAKGTHLERCSPYSPSPAIKCAHQHPASEILHPFLLPHRSRSPTTLLSRNALRRVVLCPCVPRGGSAEHSMMIVRRELRRGEWTLRRLGVPVRPRSLEAEFGRQQLEAGRQDNEREPSGTQKGVPGTSGPTSQLPSHRSLI